ncbi:MAG: hypothetical protein Q4F81_05185 [Eubacteriales bacterium]|nr:hypothetical protein [Eubacteriales bacterium]
MYGVFMTPRMRAIAGKMDKIEDAAVSRSNNVFSPAYTDGEFAELKRLHSEYMEEKKREGL